jgi:hypothetical protein
MVPGKLPRFRIGDDHLTVWSGIANWRQGILNDHRWAYYFWNWNSYVRSHKICYRLKLTTH